jgi:hypothetical protein
MRIAQIISLVLSANRRHDDERSLWSRLLGLDHHHHHPKSPVAAAQTLCRARLPGHRRGLSRYAPKPPWLQPRLAASIL